MSRNNASSRISTCLVIFGCIAFIAAESKPGIWYEVEPLPQVPRAGGLVRPEWGEGRFFFRPTTNTVGNTGFNSRLEIVDANTVKLQEKLDGQLISLNKILEEVNGIEKEIENYNPKQPYKGNYGEPYSHQDHYENSESGDHYQHKPQPILIYTQPPYKGDYGNSYSHHHSNDYYGNSEPDDHYKSKSPLVWICSQAQYKGDYEEPYSHHKSNGYYENSEPDYHYQHKKQPVWICKQTSYKGESHDHYEYPPPKYYGRNGRFLPNSNRDKQLEEKNKLSKSITKSNKTIKEKSSDKSSKTLKSKRK